MERIIFYVLPLFVLLVVYLAFKLFKNRSLYLAAAQNQNRCGGSPYEKENNQIFHHSLIFNCFWYSSTLIS